MIFLKNMNVNRRFLKLASILEVSREEIVMATDALRDPASLQEQLYENDSGDALTLMDQMKDERSEKSFDHIPLRELLEKLEKREQMIIYLRYYLDCTQSDIAERLGISQVQVSRLEKKILTQLKTWLVPAGFEEQSKAKDR